MQGPGRVWRGQGAVESRPLGKQLPTLCPEAFLQAPPTVPGSRAPQDGAGAGPASLLTVGETAFHVAKAGVTRRQLYRSDAAGGKSQPVTWRSGGEWLMLLTSDPQTVLRKNFSFEETDGSPPEVNLVLSESCARGTVALQRSQFPLRSHPPLLLLCPRSPPFTTVRSITRAFMFHYHLSSISPPPPPSQAHP